LRLRSRERSIKPIQSSSILFSPPSLPLPLSLSLFPRRERERERERKSHETVISLALTSSRQCPLASSARFSSSMYWNCSG